MQLTKLALAATLAVTIGAASALAQDTTHHSGTSPESTAPSATPPARPAREAMEPGMPMGEGHMMMQPGSAGGRGMNPEMMAACQGMMADMRERDMVASMRDEPVAAAFDAINRRMHRDMAMPTGADPDNAFAQVMIAHHQGAIDMARVVLGFGTDPEIRKLAQEVITAQEGEIAVLRQWLARQPQP